MGILIKQRSGIGSKNICQQRIRPRTQRASTVPRAGRIRRLNVRSAKSGDERAVYVLHIGIACHAVWIGCIARVADDARAQIVAGHNARDLQIFALPLPFIGRKEK